MGPLGSFIGWGDVVEFTWLAIWPNLGGSGSQHCHRFPRPPLAAERFIITFLAWPLGGLGALPLPACGLPSAALPAPPFLPTWGAALLPAPPYLVLPPLRNWGRSGPPWARASALKPGCLPWDRAFLCSASLRSLRTCTNVVAFQIPVILCQDISQQSSGLLSSTSWRSTRTCRQGPALPQDLLLVMQMLGAQVSLREHSPAETPPGCSQAAWGQVHWCDLKQGASYCKHLGSSYGTACIRFLLMQFTLKVVNDPTCWGVRSSALALAPAEPLRLSFSGFDQPRPPFLNLHHQAQKVPFT